MNDRPVIALDAMGGDHAPDAMVAGALRAHDELGATITLVGLAEVIADSLTRLGRPDALSIVSAGGVIGMDEDVAMALRAKPDASVRVAADLVAQGQADAMVSAGSTGATLAAGMFALGRVDGVRRPAVAAVLPIRHLGGQFGTVLVDAGASADVTADVLVGFARMGVAYAQVLSASDSRPRVGLLNIGSEAGKGNALAKEAYGLLSQALGDAFAGNVEPADVFAGAVDVVVTDGFTGNVFLKTVEACSAQSKMGESKMDSHVGSAHGTAGAAVLLGVKGNVLVAHGGAQPEEILAALTTAAHVAVENLSGRVAQALAQPTVEDGA